jgi:CsoR family transcriptional regulator, copper-sensing transcriptional repressor
VYMRATDSRNSIEHRLKIARGHLDKVLEMIKNDRYCIDILTQSQAVQAALRETDALILENHLKTCVADAVVKNGGEKEKAVAEVVKVFKKRG